MVTYLFMPLMVYVIGIGTGWYLCRKFGTQAAAAVKAVEQPKVG